MKNVSTAPRSNHVVFVAAGSLLLGSSAFVATPPAQAATDLAATASSSILATPPVSLATPLTDVSALAASPAVIFNCSDSSQDAECTLQLRLPGNTQPIVLSALSANVTQSGTGYHFASSVTIKTPVGDIPLTEADLLVSIGGSDQSVAIQGTASLPFPKLGFLKDANITQSGTVIVGIDSGANLEQLGAHLNPDQSYLVFHFDQGLSGSVGPMKITAPGGHSATLVLDPADPYFYIGGSGFAGAGTFGVEFCDTPEACQKTGEDYGFGISLNGQIPFQPDRPELLFPDFADALQDMRGHVVLDGTIPLGDLPLSITGSAVVNIDTDNDGITFFDSPLDAGGIPTNALGIDTKMAAKGTLDVTIPFLKVFETGIQLAEGTLLMTNSKFEKSVYFNGIQDVGSATLPVIPKYLPLTQETVLNVNGHFLIDTTNFATPEGRQQALESMKEGYLVADGSFTYDASTLGALASIDLSSLLVANARFAVDKHGFSLSGTSTSSVPIPHVNFGGNLNFSLDIPADDINASDLSLAGHLNVAGIPLGQGSLRINKLGAGISGQLDAGLGKINMSGQVTRSSVLMQGGTSVTIPLSAFAQALGPQIDEANSKLQNAINEVNRLNLQIDAQRRIVQAEHDKVSADLANAQRAVAAAQSGVTAIQIQINNAYAQISRYNADIRWWQSWFDGQPWYNKTWAWAKLGYEVSWRGTAIGGLYVYIGTLEGSKQTALGTLRAAQQVLAGINTAILNIPVDSDVRVATLIGSLKLAQGTLIAAQATVNLLPRLGDFNGSTTLAISNNGLSGTVSGNYVFIANGAVTTMGVSGDVIIEANRLKACLNIPGANHVCVGI